MSTGLTLARDSAINWMRVAVSPFALKVASSSRRTIVSVSSSPPAGIVASGTPFMLIVPLKGLDPWQKKSAGIGFSTKLVNVKPVVVCQRSAPFWTTSAANAGTAATRTSRAQLRASRLPQDRFPFITRSFSPCKDPASNPLTAPGPDGLARRNPAPG